jgi:hypothetical protein
MRNAPSLRLRALHIISAYTAVDPAIHTLPTPALLTRSATHSAALLAFASHALLALTSLAFFSLGIFHDGSPYWDGPSLGPTG